MQPVYVLGSTDMNAQMRSGARVKLATLILKAISERGAWDGIAVTVEKGRSFCFKTVGSRSEILEWGVRLREACCYHNDYHNDANNPRGPLTDLMPFDSR